MACGTIAGGLHASAGYAQEESVLIQPAIPVDYDRGRNIGVLERARPDYDPLGIRAGSVLIYPELDLGVGASNNLFLSSNDRQSDGYALIAPSVHANTDWSRNEIDLSGGGRFRRYFTFPLRNQDEWYFKGLGRLDIGSSYSITAEGQAERTQEEPFTGEAESNVAALSSYRRNYGAIRGRYREGRISAVLSYDYQDFKFSQIEMADGSLLNQDNRNRRINRVAGQFEYAFSPSTAAYTQISYLDTKYDTPLAPGIANRDSTGYRAIAGLSIDSSGFFRGIIGIGYTERNYDSPLYKDVHGLSAEAKIEYFPSELTTVTFNLRRVIEDSNIGVTSAYFDNRVSLRVDHELLRNLILNASAEYSKQDYIASPENDNIWQVRAGAHYFASRTLGLRADLSYGHRREFANVSAFTISEVAGSVSLIIQR